MGHYRRWRNDKHTRAKQGGSAVLKFEQESNGQKEADFHGVLKYVEHEGANNAVIEGAQLAKSIAIHWRRQSKKQRPFPYIVEPRV